MVHFFDVRSNICQRSISNGGSSTSQPTLQSTSSPANVHSIYRLTSPPAYTPAADVHNGETTIGISPHRPFLSSSSSRTLALQQFINRLIPRSLRFRTFEDFPYLEKEGKPDVESDKAKIDLIRNISNHLILKPGKSIDIDLLDENRFLVHSGKLFYKPGSIFEFGWTELFVLLFCDYLVITKPKKREGVMKYHLYGRPIPLDLLTLANFTDSPTRRITGLHNLFPFTVPLSGRASEKLTMYAESSQMREEWKQKLDKAIELHKESNAIFEIETHSRDIFHSEAGNEHFFTGKITCSVPFTTPDGHRLIAIGCAEGVWMGFRYDAKSMRRVLHLKKMTQCAILEDFGIFLVLSDKSLFAYHIESLVPSPQSVQAAQIPQKLSGNHNVHFFRVGTLHGQTLVIYKEKKHSDSIFRVLKPVINNVIEQENPFVSSMGVCGTCTAWLHVDMDFCLPSDSFDLAFLTTKIAILCPRAFKIVDLTSSRSVTIPHRDLAVPLMKKVAKHCRSCRPIALFRANDDEFLLCYDKIGLYVDKYGDPNRSTSVIEWEGIAERAAVHSLYILLFNTRFIEVRHIHTGRLCQIIPGNDIRCTWDGLGLNRNVAAQDEPSQEARIHSVMTKTKNDLPPGSQASGIVAEQVFELVPTVSHSLPG